MSTTVGKRQNGGNRGAIIALFAGSVSIIVLGAAYGVYAWSNQIVYTVFGLGIPGYALAAFAVFLGLRYFVSVMKLRKKMNG